MYTLILGAVGASFGVCAFIRTILNDSAAARLADRVRELERKDARGR